jgi:hypothetical protein
MGKSSPKVPDTQTVKQETIPDWLKPSVLDVVGRARSVADQPYTPYPYERIAGFTPAQQQAQQNMLGMQAPNQFAFGSGLAAAAGQGSLQGADYTPARFTAQQIGPPNLQQYGMTGPQLFGVEQAGQYMSPYMQNVMDVQKREAVRDAQRGQLVQDLGAARQGTYGGSRQLLAGLERERQLGQRLGDIQATGQQAAYESAQAQFERDRAAQMQTAQQNLAAQLGVQELGTQAGLQAMQGNQQAALEAQRLGEQSRQFGSSQGLAGLAQAGQMAQTLGNLGQYQQQADIQRLNMMQQAAGLPQALEQQRLDQFYADFLRQRDYPQETLGFYSNVIRGLPAGSQTTSLTYGAPPSISSQVLGTGLGALGAARYLGAG